MGVYIAFGQIHCVLKDILAAAGGVKCYYWLKLSCGQMRQILAGKMEKV
jgi:hypothetical protein